VWNLCNLRESRQKGALFGNGNRAKGKTYRFKGLSTLGIQERRGTFDGYSEGRFEIGGWNLGKEHRFIGYCTRHTICA
jgi:hypothetical protein